jgi:hypothetical protein
VKTPAGDFDTVRVARVSEGERKESADLWLAAELGYLPVKLVVVEKDGTRLEQTAVRVTKG